MTSITLYHPDGTLKFGYVVALGAPCVLALTMAVHALFGQVRSGPVLSSGTQAYMTVRADAPARVDVDFKGILEKTLRREGWDVTLLHLSQASCAFLLAKPGIGVTTLGIPCEGP